MNRLSASNNEPPCIVFEPQLSLVITLSTPSFSSPQTPRHEHRHAPERRCAAQHALQAAHAARNPATARHSTLVAPLQYWSRLADLMLFIDSFTATALAPTPDTVAKPTVHYGKRESLAYLVSRLPPSYVITRRVLKEVGTERCILRRQTFFSLIQPCRFCIPAGVSGSGVCAQDGDGCRLRRWLGFMV